MFDKTKLEKAISKIKGKKLKSFFYQPTRFILGDNIFVFNLNNGYSLHVACFLRISHNNEIILTSSDEFVDCKYKKLSYYDEKNFIKNTLLEKAILNVKKLLKKAEIINIEIYGCADLKISFSNDLIIDVLLDCQYDDYEYYRLFDLYNAGVESLKIGFRNGDVVYL